MGISKRLNNPHNFYYGWIIVAVSFISMACWMGIRSNFSVFYVALLEEFSWNRGDSAAVYSLALITYTVIAPLVGGLIDRFGPRRIIVPGIFIFTLGLTLCGTIESLNQFYLIYGVIMGSGITCISIVSYSSILAHWFERKRGLASGIALSGMGLGTLTLVPLSQYFISMWGWRLTFIALGVILLIILLPINGIFLRHKPREVGQFIDGLNNKGPTGLSDSNVTVQGQQDRDWTITKALSSLSFWALMTFPFLSIIGTYTVLVHNVQFMVDQGIHRMTAAFIFAAFGVISSIFRIFWGWLSDRIGRETTYSMGILCACMGVASLILLEKTGIQGFIYTFALFFGMGWGVTAPMFISTAADLFKGRIFGLIYGFIEASIGIAGAFGPWLAGYIFDRTQSYHWAFVIVLIAYVFSALIIWIAAPRKAHPRGTQLGIN